VENSISRHQTGGSHNFKEIKKRFIALNKARYVRTTQIIRPSQKDFLELLPLLYHVNHPILAGYVSSKTPCGIPEYSPSKNSISIAKRYYKSFVLKKRAYRSYAIQAIYLMGSSGSIAYSDKSDFDILVITRKPSQELNTRLSSEISSEVNKNEYINTYVSIIIEDIYHVNARLEENRYFYLDIKREGILLYDS